MSLPHLEGSIRELALPDVLQLLELGRKSGVLHVRDDAQGASGTLTLREGLVCDATHGGAPTPPMRALTAERLIDVACELLAIESGRFTFTPADASDGDRHGPEVRVEALLVEAARRADEWARLADTVPHAEIVLELADDGDADATAPVALSARQWALLSEIDGLQSVGAVAATLGRPALEVAADCAKLVVLGLVRVAERVEVGAVPSAPLRSSRD